MMQPIRVKRYEDNSHGYDGTIEPDDGSWIAFVPAGGGAPQVWVRAADGSYAPA